jgi:DnaK suppressor protein
MNPRQLDFFKQRLELMREELNARAELNREALAQVASSADPADRASLEEERFVALRLGEREVLLRRKVEEALDRIHRGTYGYCVKSGEPIGIQRLLARPTATMAVDVKQQHELLRAHHA